MSDELDDLRDPWQGRVGRRPDRTPPDVSTARLVGRVYTAADRTLRAQLLDCLLWPLSPLGRAAVAAGVFAKFVTSDGFESVLAAMDDATRFSSEQVAELSRFVQQVSPQALDRFAQLATSNRVATTTFAIAAAALLLKTLSESRA